MDTKFQKKHESDMTKKEKRELEREKLASMDGKGKAEYILGYYKFHILGIVGLVLFAVGIVKWIGSFQDETMLYASVINGRGLEEELMEHFQAYLGDMDPHHKFILDTSVAFSNEDGSGELDYAGQMKMTTLVGAATTDLFICPQSVYQQYSQEPGLLVSVEEMVGEEFVAAHKEIFEKDAVRVEGSEVLEKYGYQNSGPAYLIVFGYSGRQEVAADFIRFLVE